MCVDGEFLLVASAFRAPDIFGRFMICNDTSPNIVRHSVGGYHRSLSRSKPEFESPWRNETFLPSLHLPLVNMKNLYETFLPSLHLPLVFDWSWALFWSIGEVNPTHIRRVLANERPRPLWTHTNESRPITFSLTVDNFGVKYICWQRTRAASH